MWKGCCWSYLRRATSRRSNVLSAHGKQPLERFSSPSQSNSQSSWSPSMQASQSQVQSASSSSSSSSSGYERRRLRSSGGQERTDVAEYAGRLHGLISNSVIFSSVRTTLPCSSAAHLS